MTRDEHLAFCKVRALEYIEIGQVQQAITSMMSDLQKHDGTRGLTPELAHQSMAVMLANDPDKARHFIESFR